MDKRKNVVLIGMPGAGKSTVGVVAAKRLGFRFLDSDLLIQDEYGKLLHELITEHGVEGFWEIENKVNASIDVKQTVIATGGSVCYEEEAMKHLSEIGVVVYLKLSYEALEERLGDLNGQTLRDLYEERIPMYEKYALVTINCEGKELREVAEEVSARAAEFLE